MLAIIHPHILMNSERISKIEYALRIAETVAQRSEDPFRKVGAVALSEDGRILATGYNGLAPGKTVAPPFWYDRDERLPYMIHAEANCMAGCVRGEVYRVAVTLQPCSTCMQMMIAHGVKEIYYREPYERDNRSLQLAEFYQVKLIHQPS